MPVHPDEAEPFFYVRQEDLRILFVDDDPILREFAMVNLASDRATVETAPDGAAALAAIEAAAPDILLLDLEMPELDGLEVLRRLKADPRHGALPVVVVAGREDIEAVDRAFAAGATSFVVKPLNWRLIAHQLRYVHRTAQLQRLAADREGQAVRQLQEVAAEAAKFLALALAHEPDLKPAAAAFAKAAETALKAGKSAAA
jgi:CheY-like chemotaxis protein